MRFRGPAFILLSLLFICMTGQQLQSGQTAKSMLEREAGLCARLGTTAVIEGDELIFRPDSK